MIAMKPLALYIGLRYTRSKRRHHFISFSALASVFGIALGITVLITVLSVINGFDEKIRDRFFAIAPQMTVMTLDDIIHTWQKTADQLTALPQIQAAAPFISGQGMVTNAGLVRGIQVIGILPDQEIKISQLSQQVIAGRLDTLTANSHHIMLGQTLADDLKIKVGDTVRLFSVEEGQRAGVLPRFNDQAFVVSAIFKSSQGFGFDRVWAYLHISDAERLLSDNLRLNGLHLKLTNLYQAPWVKQAVTAILPAGDRVTDWTDQFGSFFKTLAMQKTMLFVVLLFIIGIAVFNLVATLIMVVNEKRADIAILRTLGATPRMVMMTFMVQGAWVGLIGTVLGLCGGVLLSLNITHIADWIQTVFQIQLISESVYFVNFLPSKILWWDVWQVCGTAFGLSVLAALYPAMLAYRTQPAEVLRQL